MTACSECGKEFRRRQYNAEFCGSTCRRVFNNRRAVRGAALYDLTMMLEAAAHNKQRDVIRAALDTKLKEWRLEDDRPGLPRKRTWQRPFNVFNTI